MPSSVFAKCKAFGGRWLFVDWPFAKLLEIQASSGRLMDVRLYDVDCDDIAEVLPRGTEKMIKGSLYDVLCIKHATNNAIRFSVRYSEKNPIVDYVLHKPKRNGTMSVECRWTEEYVNTCRGTRNGNKQSIIGRWRYCEKEYSSLVIDVSIASDGKYRVDVTDSANLKAVPIKLLGIGEAEIEFAVKDVGMTYRIVAKGSNRSICYITQKELWTHCAFCVEANVSQS